MRKKLRYIIFNTDIGWVGILGSTKGLIRTTLPQHSVQEAYHLLGDGTGGATWSPHWFEDLTERFKLYLSGHKTVFADGLDLSAATTFQGGVWEITKLIPYGEIRSYTWVAEQIGKPGAMRAVGQALSRNPLPIIIPCHRVLNINGNLGGYGGGVEMKRYLLHLEASSNRAMLRIPGRFRGKQFGSI